MTLVTKKVYPSSISRDSKFKTSKLVPPNNTTPTDNGLTDVVPIESFRSSGVVDSLGSEVRCQSRSNESIIGPRIHKEPGLCLVPFMYHDALSA